jgi:DNA-binding transcriptional regulator YdaS (Cro superfamily)
VLTGYRATDSSTGMGIETSIESPLALAVRRAGSQSAFARLIGRGQATVHDWLKEGKPLPGEYVLTVERKTGVSKHELRPDLYPTDLTIAAPATSDFKAVR